MTAAILGPELMGILWLVVLLVVMVGIPCIGADKRNRAWDAAHPRKVKRDA